jgi:hypothetical protein
MKFEFRGMAMAFHFQLEERFHYVVYGMEVFSISWEVSIIYLNKNLLFGGRYLSFVWKNLAFLMNLDSWYRNFVDNIICWTFLANYYFHLVTFDQGHYLKWACANPSFGNVLNFGPYPTYKKKILGQHWWLTIHKLGLVFANEAHICVHISSNKHTIFQLCNYVIERLKTCMFNLLLFMFDQPKGFNPCVISNIITTNGNKENSSHT